MKYCTAVNANSAYEAMGGAVYGRLGVTVSNSSIVLGTAGVAADEGFGGAIYSPSQVILVDSFVSNSSAALGGGVFAGDGFVSKYSSILSNSGGYGGGVYAGGNTAIQNSTIAGNSAVSGGGLWLSGTGAVTPITMVNSTVSGNEAQKWAGVMTKYSTRIANSTIAFNVEANGADTKYGAGFYTLADSELQSNIIAQNSLNHSTSGYISDDIAHADGVVLSGADNLARSVLIGSFAPADTIYADPLVESTVRQWRIHVDARVEHWKSGHRRGQQRRRLLRRSAGNWFPESHRSQCRHRCDRVQPGGRHDLRERVRLTRHSRQAAANRAAAFCVAHIQAGPARSGDVGRTETTTRIRTTQHRRDGFHAVHADVFGVKERPIVRSTAGWVKREGFSWNWRQTGAGFLRG